MTKPTDDMEKTTFMPVQQTGAQVQGRPSAASGSGNPAQQRVNLHDTREMPAVQPGLAEEQTTYMPPVQPQTGHVRRLTPQQPALGMPQRSGQPGQSGKQPFWTPKRKRAAILVGGFAVALFLGFLLAGWSQERQLAAEQQKLEQQQMKDRQAKLDGQVTDLQQQKQALERQIKQLEARQAELEKQQQQSALDKVLSAVTGGKKQGSEAQSVKQQIADAQSTVQDIDQKIDTAKAVGQQANAVKDKAVQTYKENEGVINQALGYAKAGAQLVLGWLR